ncbi:MAG: S8 family serine peptidase [Actinomycetota bacterium]|nr:S8 family serine peptidase [Actinomycetota bacterium]
MRRAAFAVLSAVLVAAVLGAPVSASPAGTVDDPYSGRQWGLTQIQARDAWDVSRGVGAVVAVLDTGVDLTHPDLDDNIISFPDADMIDPDGRDGAQDEDGHGTHVAGIIAAEAGNGIGVAGTSPRATILPVRVLGPDGGTTAQIADGIRYAVRHGAKVINLSLGYDLRGHLAGVTGGLGPVHDAIETAWQSGAVIVVAAGNDSVPLCSQPSTERVLCVGSVDRNEIRSWFSNSDATMTRPFLVAPGGDSLGGFSLGDSTTSSLFCNGDVISTYLRTEGSYCAGQPGYESLGGTSMAAPFVSGVAALLSAQGHSNQEIVDCLVRTASDLGAPSRDPIYGYGRVDALAAVTNC